MTQETLRPSATSSNNKKRPSRLPPRTILLVCEGKTDQIFFDKILSFLDLKNVVVTIKSSGGSALAGVVMKLKEHYSDYDLALGFADTDNFIEPEWTEMQTRFFKKYGLKVNIPIISVIVVIETWLLLLTGQKPSKALPHKIQLQKLTGKRKYATKFNIYVNNNLQEEAFWKYYEKYKNQELFELANFLSWLKTENLLDFTAKI